MTTRLSVFPALLLTLLMSLAQGATEITVTTDRTPVKVGKRTIGVLRKGTTLKVLKTQGDWYAVRISVGGEVKVGWVQDKYVEVKEVADEPKVSPQERLERAAAKEWEQRKPMAEALAAEGKWPEAIAALDVMQKKYPKTKAAKEAQDLSFEYDRKSREDPKFLENQAKAEFEKCEAESKEFETQQKLVSAMRVWENFPGKFEKTEYGEKAKEFRLKLAQRHAALFEDARKSVLEMLGKAAFDEAKAGAQKVKDIEGSERFLAGAEAYIEARKKLAEAKEPSSDLFAADPYLEEQDYRAGLGQLVPMALPEGVTTLQIRQGEKVVAVALPTPAQQIAAGEQLLAKYPWSPSVPLLLARLQARAGQTETALSLYRQAVLLDGGCSILGMEAQLEQMRVLVRAKEAEKAVALGQQYVEAHPNDFIGFAALGHAHQAMEKPAGAVAAWEKSLKLNPHQPDLQEALALAKGQRVEPPALTKLPLPELVKKVQESCVLLIVGPGAGSGFAVRADGLIATNFHVIRSGGKIVVRAKRGDKFITISDVQVVLVDPVRDVALLKVNARKHVFRPLPLGSAKTVQPGEDVVVIGNPGMGGKILDYTITRGIVSNRDREIGQAHCIQTDAAVNPGNSGGPMFNMKGQVIGMVTMKALVMERVGLALHIEHVKEHLQNCFPQ